MYIERLEVEEGFLNGLSLEFSPGLNVIIGPRGVGKTSIIELTRFAMGIPGFTDESDREARQHAISVLKGGRVTVTVRAGADRVAFTRTADEESPRASGGLAGARPTILSQREIERVGLDATGRLRLVDAFRVGVEEAHTKESSLHGIVRSLTLQMKAIADEVVSAEAQVEALRLVPEQLAAAEESEAAALATVAELRSDRERLDEVSALVTQRSVQQGILERMSTSLSSWRDRIDATLAGVPLMEDWPATGSEALPNVEIRIGEAEASLRAATETINRAISELEGAMSALRFAYIALQDEARQLRQRLDEVQKGAGNLSRQVSVLRESAGQRDALQSLVGSKCQQLEEVQARRRLLLDQLDELQGLRYEQREEVIARLNSRLGPRLDIGITRFGLQHEYTAAVIAGLRGSGLHRTLAPIIATSMSPRELAEAVERGDSQLLADLADIPSDRAHRAVEAIRQAGTQDILTVRVEDNIILSLLDGGEYKTTDTLSTGQRCTVVLPLILSHEGRVVVVDQPEDHLDNAFIVDTIIDALLRVHDSSQMIISSHNANIPVLGNADQVIVLGSDGDRGFVRAAGNLDDPAIVEAITSVMEGGHEAFQRRAEFYRARLSPDRG